MNIGFFTDSYFPQVNGVTYTVDAWRKELEKRGHMVYIYYPKADYTPGEREHEFGSIDFKSYPGYKIAFPVRICDKTRHLDLVHAHTPFGLGIAGLRAARAHKLPRMFTFHTPGDEYISYITKNPVLKPLLTSISLRWDRFFFNQFTRITTASPVIKEKLEDNRIGNVELLSNGLDLSLFHRVDPRGFREKHGIADGRVIGFCGRLGYEKHVEDLISAADRFDGTVLIAGKGPAEDHYRKLSEGRDNVKMLGFLRRDTLKEFYSALDVFVFPSFAETQGLVAVESMACGTPVVGVPVLALKTTIEDGKTGYHYKAGDIDDLLEKVERAYENRKVLVKGCLEEAGRHSVDRVVDRLEGIYGSL
ncbi:MAG: glycosyltransferase [Candidatus Altiarchaeales archaeon]|nr:glycosyltransferase [Candidatus Altiarchaeales archaeon]MBD3417207.1 glycosyltransferase [Candidatus Altiarchaeales archaeon]